MTSRVCLTLTALALLQPGLAQAEMVDFSYAISVSPSPADLGGVLVKSYLTPSGTASATVGAQRPMPFSGVAWISIAPPGGYPDLGINLSEQANVTVTDQASGQSGQFSFIDHIVGHIGPSERSWKDVPPSGPQTMRLGNYLYQFQGDILQLPGPGDGGVFEEVELTIKVSSAANAQAPEPSCLVLGGVAAGVFAAARWRCSR